jgi:hypothetical protein
VVGYEDLDDYGGWRPEPEYGTVWFPHVTVVNWAPYRYGHWAWISPWGWTWVDDAPWGFAPFHYGRWVSVRGAWGWVPCPPRTVAVAYMRPVYAPALVAWVGGPHFGVGIGVGVGANVGWFPLGPREVYVPSYHVSRGYVNNVNISNTTVNQTVINNYYNTTVVNRNVNVTNVRYMNQNVRGGVTATSGQNFASARPVGNNLVRVDQREAASAPVVMGAPTGAPPRQAVLGSGNPTNYHPPVAVQNRAVVAKVAPPPPPPTFARQQAAIQANEGRPISVNQARQLQPENNRVAAAPVKMAPAATVMTPRVNNVQGGINRQGRPGQNDRNRQVNGNPNAPQVNPNAQQANPNMPANSNVQPNPQPNPNRPAGANPPQVNPNAPNNTAPNTPQNVSRPPNANAPQVNPNAPANQSAPANSTVQPNPQVNGNRPPAANTVAPANQRPPNDRPSGTRPNNNSVVDPQLEQKHEQQNQQLQQKQDQERQKLDDKRYQQEQQLQKQKANDARQQQIEQKEQQQLQRLEQKHDQQQEHLKQKQETDHSHASQHQPPPPKPKPADDKPHQ